MSIHRPAVALLVVFIVAASVAPLARAQTPAPVAATQPAPVPAAPAAPPAQTDSGFQTRILAGGAVNQFRLEGVQPSEIAGLPTGQLTWKECAGNKSGSTPSLSLQARTKSALASVGDNQPVGTILTFAVPYPPCMGSLFGTRIPRPVYQDATIRIDGRTPTGDSKLLFEGEVPVSVRWLPLAVTMFVLAIIYPGCALVAYAIARRRHARQNDPNAAAPSFWQQLDPVQITANMYGRGSLAKLQTFSFSFIVFGLLLYYQFRNGILSGLSTDVLYLLGISAFGTVGARVTYAAKRRLSLDNWVWLRRKGWMPDAGGATRRALWRELIVDGDSKEFDPYSFQMAIFSIVVGIALVSSSLIGLSTFEIPAELLGLLGLSQIVFIGGKAAETSPFNELDKRISSLRDHERKYREAIAIASTAKDDAKAKAEADALSEHKAFKEDVRQAADMFQVLYAETLTTANPNLKNADTLEPEGYVQSAPVVAAPPVVAVTQPVPVLPPIVVPPPLPRGNGSDVTKES